MAVVEASVFLFLICKQISEKELSMDGNSNQLI